MFKNVASQKLIVFAFDVTTGLPKTGDAANLTAYVSKDYGTVTVLGDTSATEMDATNAKGYYLFDLTQAETNANTLLFSCKSATANVSVVAQPATVFTRPANASSLAIDSSGQVTVGAFAAGVSSGAVHSGTAQSGSTSSAIKLSALASSTNDLYNGETVVLTGGTGAGQSRVIQDYAGSTQLATVNPNWITTPDATTTYAIQPYGSANVEMVELLAPEDGAAIAVAVRTEMDANSTQFAAILADTAEIGVAGIGLTAITGKLPAALISGRIDASVGAMAANTLTASALATDAVTEMNVGMATSVALGLVATDVAAVLVDTGTTFDGRIPAALVGGRMDASVGVMGANVITSAAIATDAITAAKIAADVQTELAGATALATVNTTVNSILAKTNLIPTDPADASDISALINALPTGAETALEVWNLSNTPAAGFTPAQALHLAAAGAASVTAGMETASGKLKSLENDRDLVTAALDGNNRLSVVYDL